jgi:hypothetical protein
MTAVRTAPRRLRSPPALAHRIPAGPPDRQDAGQETRRSQRQPQPNGASPPTGGAPSPFEAAIATALPRERKRLAVSACGPHTITSKQSGFSPQVTSADALRRGVLELAVALDADQNGTHLVALRQHQLVDRAGVKPSEQSWQLAHRLANGCQLRVRDPDWCGLAHCAPKRYAPARTDP